MSLGVELFEKVDGVDRLVFEANITHNLNRMAEAAGFYKEVWRPEEIGVKQAKQLVEPLTNLIAKLKSDQEYFETFEPENKWGKYVNFVPWLEKYLSACKEYPEALVSACR